MSRTVVYARVEEKFPRVYRVLVLVHPAVPRPAAALREHLSSKLQASGFRLQASGIIIRVVRVNG